MTMTKAVMLTCAIVLAGAMALSWWRTGREKKAAFPAAEPARDPRLREDKAAPLENPARDLQSGKVPPIKTPVRSLRFDGVDDHMRIDFTPAPGPALFSILFWMYVDPLGMKPGKGTLVKKRRVIIPFELVPATTAADDVLKTVKLYIVVPAKGGSYITAMASAWDPETRQAVQLKLHAGFGQETEYGPGRWHHVAILVGAMTARFYLDGRRVGDFYFDKFLPYALNPDRYRLYLGMSPWRKGSCHFRGRFAHLMIFQRLLSRAEIRQRLGAPLPAAQKTLKERSDCLLAYWPLQENPAGSYFGAVKPSVVLSGPAGPQPGPLFIEEDAGGTR